MATKQASVKSVSSVYDLARETKALAESWLQEILNTVTYDEAVRIYEVFLNRPYVQPLLQRDWHDYSKDGRLDAPENAAVLEKVLEASA